MTTPFECVPTWTNMLSLPFSLSWPVVILVLSLIYVIERAISYYKALRSVSFLPGLTFPASSYSIPGSLFPSTEWNPGMIFGWRWRDRFYKDSPMDMASQIGLLNGPPVLYTNSPEVAKQVLGNKAPWDKIKESVQSLSPFGPNVFATMSAEWPRHRKAVSPGFNGRLYSSVWTETKNTYYDCLATEKWENEREFIMPDVTAVTSKFALYLIAKCGFGIGLSWNEDVGERVRGMSLPECFEVTSNSVIILSFLPHWTYSLPIPALRRLYNASNILETIFKGIIDKRRVEGFGNTSEDKDIFSLLLAANELEKGSKGALSDRELVSNVFLLLLAGHETTSKSLAATLGELACNPEVQQHAYDEIMSVIKEGSDPTFDDFEKLPFVQGCFQEGLRMYPSAQLVMRRPVEDTVLQVPSRQGGVVPLSVPLGQVLALDFVGIGYNARVYKDPKSFNPARWLDPATEPLLNFSYGPRVCIGKRFAMVESTGVLALLLRDYKVEPILKDGQTIADWHAAWVENVEATVGFGHKRFPLKFTRRSARAA
ncbi:cytochrome P450 [Dacryopinax primogenitus]|uniref:Cytochrome P450 n=1 Tax=Dacryopinax primogenitus (strain DJM 731) TaxID=1858805 RepID=M5FYP3_DACPD|nr:cytochrome P450 [Dacryopinax primogenitus]EJT98661.1 cytochrome P450 [Dacryopinax primogenitus]